MPGLYASVAGGKIRGMVEKKKKYKTEIQTLNVVAVKKDQTDVKAPDHDNWGTVTCDSCRAEFLIGPPTLFAVAGTANVYVKKLEEILAGEHTRHQQHQNSYDLGA
jgi:transcription elongation factor Elf1